MKLSKKAEYALRALAIMAARPPALPIQIQDLADTGRIPVKFLEQILLVLKRANLLKSKRGVGGGYQLDRHPAEITLAQVIRIIDGPLGHTGEGPPLAGPGCRGLKQCLDELDRLTEDHLDRETIAGLLLREEPDSVLALDI